MHWSLAQLHPLVLLHRRLLPGASQSGISCSKSLVCKSDSIGGRFTDVSSKSKLLSELSLGEKVGCFGKLVGEEVGASSVG